MVTAELYQVALDADRAFDDELRRLYGKDACNARYQPGRNNATPELARLRRAKHIADKAVHEAFKAAWTAAR